MVTVRLLSPSTRDASYAQLLVSINDNFHVQRSNIYPSQLAGLPVAIEVIIERRLRLEQMLTAAASSSPVRAFKDDPSSVFYSSTEYPVLRSRSPSPAAETCRCTSSCTPGDACRLSSDYWSEDEMIICDTMAAALDWAKGIITIIRDFDRLVRTFTCVFSYVLCH